MAGLKTYQYGRIRRIRLYEKITILELKETVLCSSNHPHFASLYSHRQHFFELWFPCILLRVTSGTAARRPKVLLQDVHRKSWQTHRPRRDGG